MGASREQPLRQRGVGHAEEVDEGRVDPGEPFGRVQIAKSQAESKLHHPGALEHAPAATSMPADGRVRQIRYFTCATMPPRARARICIEPKRRASTQ